MRGGLARTASALAGGLNPKRSPVLPSIARTSGAQPASLFSIGYTDAGIDDGWQACGAYGSRNYTYHDEAGMPQVSTAVALVPVDPRCQQAPVLLRDQPARCCRGARSG